MEKKSMEIVRRHLHTSSENDEYYQHLAERYVSIAQNIRKKGHNFEKLLFITNENIRKVVSFPMMSDETISDLIRSQLMDDAITSLKKTCHHLIMVRIEQVPNDDIPLDLKTAYEKGQISLQHVNSAYVNTCFDVMIYNNELKCGIHLKL